MNRIAIINYGMGNLHSIAKALERVTDGARIVITDRPEEVLGADRVVFPGVGASRDCMHELRRRELVEVVIEAAASRPFLGICLGMQLLLEQSEENDGTETLGILAGGSRRFPDDLREADARLKIPHMGWNEVAPTTAHPLWAGIPDRSRFYFVHSYYVVPDDPAQVAATCDYGLTFTAAVMRDNLFAVQFHPEKSHLHGLRLLANFATWDGRQ